MIRWNPLFLLLLTTAACSPKAVLPPPPPKPTLQQTRPPDARLTATLKELSAWPEFGSAIVNVQRSLPRQDFQVGMAIPSMRVQNPPLHGEGTFRAAEQRTWEMLVELMQERRFERDSWIPMGPALSQVPEMFSITLAPKRWSHAQGMRYGFPRLTVQFQVLNGNPDPLAIHLEEFSRMGGMPESAQKQSWTSFAARLYERLFGHAVQGEETPVGHIFADDVLISWAPRWNDLLLPANLRSSFGIRRNKEAWTLDLKRGPGAAGIGQVLQGLSSLRFSVTPRQAMATAAKNWMKAHPTESTNGELLGCAFELIDWSETETFIGGINRGTHYVDPEFGRRLSEGEEAIAAWALTLSVPRSGEPFRVWVTADTGRVALIWGPL